MIQLVQPQNAGKQVRVKRSGKQMEARSRWKERREAAEGSGGESEGGVWRGGEGRAGVEEMGNPTHKRMHYTMPQDNKSNMGTI